MFVYHPLIITHKELKEWLLGLKTLLLLVPEYGMHWLAILI